MKFIFNATSIIGFIICHEVIWDYGNQGFLDELAVIKKFQGKGYGKMLFKYAERYFKKKEIKNIALMANTKSKAYKMYKKWGYKEEDYVSMEKKYRLCFPGYLFTEWKH